MRCSDLHINVQDASGDRILAGDALTRDRTDWYQWVNNKGVYTFESGDLGRQREEEEDTHPEHVVGEVWRKKKKRKFKRTPSRFGRNGLEACRIYGSLEGNKVQGDFHITARGHGYMEFGEHLDHTGTFQRFFCTYDWSISPTSCCVASSSVHPFINPEHCSNFD